MARMRASDMSRCYREAIWPTEGRGGITGPYRGYLYYWKTTRSDDIDAISTALWPYLSFEKRTQLSRLAQDVGRVAPLVRASRSAEAERAWAAGLFDGEGCL